MSARISGVKNFESKAVSLLRGLPLSQVQSQSEKGAIFSTFVDAEPLDACSTGAGAGAVEASTVLAGVTAAGATTAGDASVVIVRLFSSPSSCSILFFMAS